MCEALLSIRDQSEAWHASIKGAEEQEGWTYKLAEQSCCVGLPAAIFIWLITDLSSVQEIPKRFHHIGWFSSHQQGKPQTKRIHTSRNFTSFSNE